MRKTLLALFLMTAAAFAADVDGKWSGSVSTPNGDFAVNYEFKADGAALTGNMQGPDGMSIAISKGKVDGNNISFSVTLDFGGMPFTLDYKGVVNGKEIKLTSDFGGQSMEFVVKKAG